MRTQQTIIDPGEYVLAGTIHDQLLLVLSAAPRSANKINFLFPALDSLFADVDWTQSFDKKMAILYDEALHVEILLALHHWLRIKCADIENIYLFTTHHFGVNQWWGQWCNTFHERSFKINELSFNRFHYNPKFEFPPCPDLEFFSSQKKLQYYFSFYGGSYFKLDQMYFLLKLLPLREHGVVEYIGNFADTASVIGYAEQVGYFKKQQEIDELGETIEKFFQDDQLIDQVLPFSTPQAKSYENFFVGHQWAVDRHCFANVVRETFNDQPYPCVTEKTTRPFLHHQVVIPACYRVVEILEQKGFWFPHDLIDYSYQHIKDYGSRITALTAAVKQMTIRWSLKDLQDYYNNNIHKFHHNNQLVYSIYQS